MIFENPCHLNPDVVKLDSLPDLWQLTYWVQGEARKASAPRKEREGSAHLAAWDLHRQRVHAGKLPVPTCSQLDFLGCPVQSWVSFSTILQPINHAGNKTPDLVPSSDFWRVCGLGSQQFGTLWKKTPSTQNKQVSSPLGFTGRTHDLGLASLASESLPFSHRKPPFYSECARHWGVIPMNPYTPH